MCVCVCVCVMSNEQQEHEKERAPSITRFLLYTPTGDMNILIYELYFMYTIIEDHCMWSYMLYVFPLSCKLSTGILSV